MYIVMKKILMTMILGGAVMAAACGTKSESDAELLARKTVNCLTIAEGEPSAEVAASYLECLQDLFNFDDSLNAVYPTVSESEEFIEAYNAALKAYNADYDQTTINAKVMEANEKLAPYLM